MKITAIHINNYKSYKGLNKIEGLDKGLSSDKNIVLFGGLNGAGKTSLLEAFFLCFYGRQADKLYPSKGAKHENYEAFLIACLNDDLKATGVVQAQMSVEVFLKDLKLIGNFPKDISFRREWVISLSKGDKKVSEKFFILENGQLVEELPESEFQDKVQSILPYGVSQFFFFDGEKIQEFAADADAEFASSLKDVLGINIYSQLSSDIKQVRQRVLSDYNKNKELDERLTERRGEKVRLEKTIEKNQIEINTLTDEVNELEIEKEKIDSQTFRFTRISAENRDAYHVEKDNKEQEREILERDYIETAKEFLPFILATDLCQELEAQLQSETEYQEYQSAQKAVEPKIEGIINAILNEEPQCPQPLNQQQKRFFEYKIDTVIRQFLDASLPTDQQEVEIIHNLSSGDTQKVFSMLQSYNRDIVAMLQRKAENLKQIELDLQRIQQTEVRSGGSSDEILRLFEQKENISKEIGRKEERMEQLLHEILESKRKLAELEKQITNLEAGAELQEKQKRQIAYCDNMQKSIHDFQVAFQAKRVSELEASILEMWNLLAQKEDHIKRIEILPDRNFEIRLYGHQDREKDKTKLSAGEKEIYAISLLWALTQVSGKQIPIIIDTPYGRLDSIHRANLAKHYFPKASHQVFLLSQDKEIVENYYEILSPFIANEFSITYNPESRKPEITPGYKFAPVHT